ncbi:MAG: nitroreductase family protein [Peptostreptococcaceae bacterium]
MEAIFKRRSIRKYTDDKVEQEKIEKLLRAAMQAPSAGNQQPWEFIVLQDKEKLVKLSHMSKYSKLIADAPLAFILLGNEDRMRYPENWEQDMGAATQNLLLEAVELDLGAVWMSAAPLDDRMNYIKNMFNLEDKLKPYCVVTVGYPAKGQENKFIDRYDESRVHYDNY